MTNYLDSRRGYDHYQCPYIAPAYKNSIYLLSKLKSRFGSKTRLPVWDYSDDEDIPVPHYKMKILPCSVRSDRLEEVLATPPRDPEEPLVWKPQTFSNFFLPRIRTGPKWVRLHGGHKKEGAKNASHGSKHDTQ